MSDAPLPPGLDAAFMPGLLDALDEAVLVVGAGPDVAWVNRAARTLFHREAAQMVGKRIGEALGCLHSEDKGCGNSAWCPCGLHDHVSEALAGEASLLRETIGIPVRLGDVIEVRSLKVTVLPLARPQGPPEQVCVVLDDRTLLVRRCDELRLVQGKMEMRLGQCESMTEMIDQDVLPPLLRLEGLLRTSGGAVPGGLEWDLDLLKLSIDNLLRVSQMDPDGLPVSKEIFDPLPAIAESVAALKEAAGRKGVVVEVRPAAPDVALVSADRRLLMRILENLLRNAVDQARSGTAVQIAAMQAGRDQVAVSVLFQGEPIPAEHLENVFDSYFHLGRPGGLDRRNRGLPYTRIASIAQGGSLRAENLEGGWVAYRLTLPSRRRPAPPPAPAAPPGENAELSRAGPP